MAREGQNGARIEPSPVLHAYQYAKTLALALYGIGFNAAPRMKSAQRRTRMIKYNKEVMNSDTNVKEWNCHTPSWIPK